MGNCLDSRQQADGFIIAKAHSEAPKRPDKPPPILTIPPCSEKGRTGKMPSPRSEDEILASPHLKPLLFSELKNATRNFRPDSLLGEGGFGCVYKGWLDEQTLCAAKPGCGIVVAVKKLKPQGYQGHKEWLSEVTHLGQLHHPNLVKLIGYCLEDDNRLLVYEFMARGSLENHLFKRSAQPLPWETRVKVAIDAARGLSFLHSSESQVIYRDFKASNILLDSEFNAKLSDFGLAKAGPTGDQTHVSTQVMGTHGYAAPEYVASGRLTAKCDVYSFGVVLLELLSGRRAVDKEKVGLEQKLVDWAKSFLDDKRKIFRLMDTKLGGQYPRKGALILATLGMSCVNLDSRARPPMDEVLKILEKIPSLKCVSVGSPLDKQTLPSPVSKSPRQLDLPSPITPSPVSKSPRQLDLPSPITPTSRESPLPSHMIPTGTMIIGR
ncbi:hypothetical protein Vadar_024439 [Vaccinium darrowii]|uniref:Uncharacterized protein n=1 Tax=Vaccinium darrowii TaxID=229202 RepID=A0ACB7YG70_9ERIC|nr:hypothetical protein Vadar_024439 [Vaccinium darrowii]